MIDHIIKLMQHGAHVAIVTAAGGAIILTFSNLTFMAFVVMIPFLMNT